MSVFSIELFFYLKNRHLTDLCSLLVLTPKYKMQAKPKVTSKHVALHKAAMNAVKHLKQLPPGLRKQLGNLPGKHMNYTSKEFHKRVSLPHQKHNLGSWSSSLRNPIVKC